MEKSVRVLVAIRTRLLRELILTTLSDQADIEIVGEVVDDADIGASVGTTNPDVVIVAQSNLGERPGICDAVLRERPQVRVLAVGPHNKCSVHYWATLQIHSQDIEASEEALLGALRAKVRAPGSLM